MASSLLSVEFETLRLAGNERHGHRPPRVLDRERAGHGARRLVEQGDDTVGSSPLAPDLFDGDRMSAQ